MLLHVIPIPPVLRRLAFLAIGVCLVSFASAAESAAAQAPAPSALSRSYGLLPLAFEANRGQTGAGVRFVASGDGYSLLIGESEAMLSLRDSAVCRTVNSQTRRAIAKCMPRSELLHMRLIDGGAGNALPMRGAEARVMGESLLPGRVNYLIGNDRAKWHTDIPTYQRVRLAEVYPGVDLLYYGNQRRLEYDFDVAPGADPQAIRIHFDGADLKLDPRGNLEIGLNDGKVMFERPVIYQNEDGGRRTVSGNFRLLDHSTMGFRIGAYDLSRPLIIDPVLSYSTFVDGSATAAAAVDAAGNAYVTGAGWQITTTAGAFQGTNNCCTYFNLGWTAFVTKLDPTGSTAIYSTYIGGSGAAPYPGGLPPAGFGDAGAGIAVDSAGNAYLTGYTYSADFPTMNPLQGQNNAYPNGNDNAFVAELNPTGSDLVYSTYLGGSGCGNGAGDGATGLALDATGAAYIVGTTCSVDFPTTAGAYQMSSPSNFDDFDAFVAKISPGGTSLVYSTYLSGSRGAYGTGVEVDSSGSAYVTGATYSTDFPVTPGAYQNSDRAGFGENAFVTKLNPTGSALVYSTYLGGSGGQYTNPLGGTTQEGDDGYAIAVDGAGNAYVTGSAGSTDFPVTPGAFQPNDGAALGITNAFVTKLNATGSSLVYSTYLGGSGGTGHALPLLGIGELGESGNAIAIDSAGNVYVAGAAGSTNFPVTAGAVQTVNHAAASGNTNAFVAELNPAGTGLLYATYLGGSGTETYAEVDYATGVAQNGVGKVYVAGVAVSGDFPTTAGAFQTTGTGSFASMLDLGIGGAAELSIAPGNLTVLSPAVGQTSTAKTVTLTNGGTGAVTIQNISIGGTNAAEFAQTNTCGNSLSAGDACTVSITFTPTAAGSRSASLSITDDAPGSPQSIPLTGNEIVYPPNASFSPTLLTFSLQTVGTISAPQTATLTNTGQGPLNITSISLGGGGSAADLYFTQTNDCGSTLAAGASCTFHVTYTPSEGGEVYDGVYVHDNQGNSPQVLQLTGIGALPAIALSIAPSNLTMLSPRVGQASAAKTVTLTNGGTDAVTIQSISIGGINAAEFTQKNTCGSSLSTGGTCMVSVTFTPTVAGNQSASLSITDNVPGSPQSIPLTGNETPNASFLPTSLTFSLQNVGTISTPQTATLTNKGQGPLNITSILLGGPVTTGSGGNESDTYYAQTNDCGNTLASGASCTFHVTFTPPVSGQINDSVLVNDNQGNSPQVLGLMGTGAVLATTLSAMSLTFASQEVGTASSAQSVTLMNTGRAPVTITSIAATGDFSETNTCGGTIAVSGNCMISVTFMPTATGSRNGTITVNDNASGSLQAITLTGIGIAPAVTLSTTSLTFSAQTVGSTSAAQTIQLTNSGQAVLSIASIAASGDFAASSTCGSTLAMSSSCAISVTFTPTAAGSRQGQITITDNAGGSPHMVSLTGAGVLPTPVAALTPASLTFTAQAVGSTSSAQTITLTNTGSAAMSVTSIAASGDFAETNTCGASLTAAASCTISITFTPTAAGIRAGTVSVTDNATDSPQTVALSGTGTSVEVTTSSQNLTVSTPGGTASDTLTLSSQDGFSGTVTLTCKVTYQGTGTAVDPPTCSINPSQGQIAANGSLNAMLTVSTTAPTMNAQSDPLRAAKIFTALLLMGFFPRRRWRKIFLVVLAIGLVGVACGCGGHSNNGGGPSNPGTSTGNYKVAVTATSATVTATTTISLTVN